MSAGKSRAVVPPRDGALQKTDAAVRAINEARNMVSDMQKQYVPGTASHAQCDSIDDKLFDALTALGD